MKFRNFIATLGVIAAGLGGGVAQADSSDAPAVRKVTVGKTHGPTKPVVVTRRGAGAEVKAGTVEVDAGGGAKTRKVVRTEQPSGTVRRQGVVKKPLMRRITVPVPATRTQDIKGQDAPARVEVRKPDPSGADRAVKPGGDLRVKVTGDDKKGGVEVEGTTVKVRDAKAGRAVVVKPGAN